jgi:hypothetical protein
MSWRVKVGLDGLSGVSPVVLVARVVGGGGRNMVGKVVGPLH